MNNSEIDWKEVPNLNGSSEETNTDIPEKSVSQSLSKKVSFSKSTKDDPRDSLLKNNTAKAVEKDIMGRNNSKDLEANHLDSFRNTTPSDQLSKDDGNDPFTCFFMFLSWILIILTFPISIFMCFKMVQVSFIGLKSDQVNLIEFKISFHLSSISYRPIIGIRKGSYLPIGSHKKRGCGWTWTVLCYSLYGQNKNS